MKHPDDAEAGRAGFLAVASGGGQGVDRAALRRRGVFFWGVTLAGANLTRCIFSDLFVAELFGHLSDPMIF